MCGLLQVTSPNMKKKECSHGFNDAMLFNCVTDQITDRTTLNDPLLLQCRSGVLMSTSETPKSILIGNTTNMKRTYPAKVTCEKEKEFSTKQTCHDKPNISRQGQEVSHSRFCKRFSTRFC